MTVNESRINKETQKKWKSEFNINRLDSTSIDNKSLSLAARHCRYQQDLFVGKRPCCVINIVQAYLIFVTNFFCYPRHILFLFCKTSWSLWLEAWNAAWKMTLMSRIFINVTFAPQFICLEPVQSIFLILWQITK